ncbi:MAG: DUF362 domain-containing protein [Candidatus Latescibacteria bacterium]|nr:DUF362 domain-containing protein [Candidatus Latescibacterota bacterium]
MQVPCVAVLKTSPKTVINDYSRLMHLAGYTDSITSIRDTALNIDLSWHHFFPGNSTPPWQLHGVLNTLIEDGFDSKRIYACYGKKNGISTNKGQVLNRHTYVIERYGIESVHIDDTVNLIAYEPTTPLRVLPDIFKNGIKLPQKLVGCNCINLSTLKTDAIATVTGSANVLATILFDDKVLQSYPVLHEILVDCIAIAKDIFSGIFTVMDGVFANEGPGPLSYMPHEKNIILASNDLVAIDAVAATVMGFDPMAIPYIRIAHEAGLGNGDINCIGIVGENLSDIAFNFKIKQPGMDYRIRSLEKFSFISGFSRFLTVLYNDFYWYVHVGEERIKNALKGEWGDVFEKYRNTLE